MMLYSLKRFHRNARQPMTTVYRLPPNNVYIVLDLSAMEINFSPFLSPELAYFARLRLSVQIDYPCPTARDNCRRPCAPLSMLR